MLGPPALRTCQHLRAVEVQQIVELVVTVHAVEVRPTPLPSPCEFSVTVVEAEARVDCLNWYQFPEG